MVRKLPLLLPQKKLLPPRSKLKKLSKLRLLKLQLKVKHLKLNNRFKLVLKNSHKRKLKLMPKLLPRLKPRLKPRLRLKLKSKLKLRHKLRHKLKLKQKHRPRHRHKQLLLRNHAERQMFRLLPLQMLIKLPQLPLQPTHFCQAISHSLR
jgi:hypothetical protein